jgi:hypothetical protein
VRAKEEYPPDQALDVNLPQASGEARYEIKSAQAL